MPELAQHDFAVGEWRIEPDSNTVSRGEVVTRLEPKVMAVLICLAEHAGEVVSKEQLMRAAWADAFVSDQVLTHAIWQLRQVLGNGRGRSEVIETIPKRGYRLVCPVEASAGPEDENPSASRSTEPLLHRVTKLNSSRRLLLAGSAFLLLAIVIVIGVRRTAQQTAAGQGHAIAVLPLENYSGDPEQAYLADGMTEELTTDLAKISSLRVISRTSMMTYKGSKKPLPEIAGELHVDTLVEGSVQRSGGRVRIAVQLIDARTQQHLWAETYERDFKDVLAIRDEVARAIASEVKVKLAPEEKQRLTSSHPVDPEAYEAYLMGRYFAGRGKQADYEKSIEYFQDAVRHDPSYALAYAEMAESYAMLDFISDLRGDNFRKAQEAAKQAAALDPSPAEVRIRMADLKMYWDWDWSQCDTGFRESARLNPGSADAQGHFAGCLLVLGRYDEALQEMERAKELDPVSPLTHRWLGQNLYNLGQYQSALERYRKTIELDPNDAGAQDGLALVYESMQQHENAVSAWTKAELLRGKSPSEVAALKAAFATGGIEGFRARYRGYRRQDLKQLTETARHTWVSPVRLAALSVAAGETDTAFKWLDKAYEHHSPQLVWLKSSITFAALRSDPRFNALLRRMNFPESTH